MKDLQFTSYQNGELTPAQLKSIELILSSYHGRNIKFIAFHHDTIVMGMSRDNRVAIGMSKMRPDGETFNEIDSKFIYQDIGTGYLWSTTEAGEDYTARTYTELVFAFQEWQHRHLQ